MDFRKKAEKLISKLGCTFVTSRDVATICAAFAEVDQETRAEGYKAGLNKAAELGDKYQTEAIETAERYKSKIWEERSIAAARVAQDIRAILKDLEER